LLNALKERKKKKEKRTKKKKERKSTDEKELTPDRITGSLNWTLDGKKKPTSCPSLQLLGFNRKELSLYCLK